MVKMPVEFVVYRSLSLLLPVKELAKEKQNILEQEKSQ